MRAPIRVLRHPTDASRATVRATALDRAVPEHGRLDLGDALLAAPAEAEDEDEQKDEKADGDDDSGDELVAKGARGRGAHAAKAAVALARDRVANQVHLPRLSAAWSRCAL